MVLRSTVTGECKRIAASAWRYDLIPTNDLRVLRRGNGFVEEVRGWTFHIWEPDLDRLWPLAAHGRS